MKHNPGLLVMHDDMLFTGTALTTQRRSTKSIFAVAHTWPTIKNAEYEVIERMAIAAKNIGSTMIAVDNNGYPLWSNIDKSLDRNKPLDFSTIDFMISFHFESPRVFDVYSYYALWQPLDFYEKFGYRRSCNQVLTHSDFISCKSFAADSHGASLMCGARGDAMCEFPALFHSPPRPYFAPKISSDSRLFYIGINWERINSERGRHHELLERLDDEGLIDIYGPRKFLGAEPWRGFKCYRGELPFDGKSVVRAIHNSGVCLALSSEAHQQSALMSNRLFEGLAAGAVIIANPNGFIDRYFADVVYLIDDKCSSEELFFQVRNILEEVRDAPEIARGRAEEGQRRLAEHFSLEECLKVIVDGHATRRGTFEEKFYKLASITIILVYPGDSIADVRECLSNVLRQVSVSISVILICDAQFKSEHQDEITGFLGPSINLQMLPGYFSRSREPGAEAVLSNTGPLVRKALSLVKTEFFGFINVGEQWFRDHITCLARAIERTPGTTFSVSGNLIEFEESEADTIGRKVGRKVASLSFDGDLNSFIRPKPLVDCGRYLFRTAIINRLPSYCLDLLNGEEPTLIGMTAALEGDLAQSGQATYVSRPNSVQAFGRSMLNTLGYAYIDDAFACNPKRRARLSTNSTQSLSSSNVDFSSAESAARPNQIGELFAPLELGSVVDVKLNATGNKFLKAGFSSPEPEFVWIEGTVGVMEMELIRGTNTEHFDYDLLLSMAGRPSSGRPQHCTVIANDIVLAYCEVPEGRTLFRFRLSRDAMSRNRMQIKVIADHADRVIDEEGKLSDSRELGVRIYSFGIVEAVHWKKQKKKTRSYLLPVSIFKRRAK